MLEWRGGGGLLKYFFKSCWQTADGEWVNSLVWLRWLVFSVYITKAGGDCYCSLVARRRPGMSDDGGETTLTLRSTNNQINPPGVAHNSPATQRSSISSKTWSRNVSRSRLGCHREFADLIHCHCLPIKCLILHLNLKQTGFISDMWPGMWLTRPVSSLKQSSAPPRQERERGDAE